MSVLFSESFTGANANPIGGNWTTNTGLAAIQRISNCSDGTAGDSGAYVNSVSPPNDQYAKVTHNGAPLTTDGGPMCRAASGAVTHYLLDFGGTLQIYLVNAGVYTAIGGSSVKTVSFGDTMQLSCVGTTLTGYWNGVSTVSTTDGTLASGLFGIFVSNVTQRYTAFEGGDFISGATPVLMGQSCL
jgi:hypothetical protein